MQLTSTTRMANMNITTKRRRSGSTSVFADGAKVGEVFKFTGQAGYGLRLYGIYWRNGVPNRKGGATVGEFRLMRDAVNAIASTLSETPPK